jgi:ATP-dependent RNA helicase DeaD
LLNKQSVSLRFIFKNIQLTDFKALGLSENVLKALGEMGFENPTEIQGQTIPILLENNRDFIGLAQTGTGKTAAFGLPLLELIDFDDRNTQALVLAPTRELAQQIAVQLESFSKYQGKLSTVCVYGGAPIHSQISQLRRGAQIIVGTPGRLIDLADRGAVKLNQLRFLVLDEADEMLNMGFKDELDKILSFTPEEKTTWLFSATMPREIRGMVKSYMNDPQEVKVNSGQVVNENISHQFVITKASEKPRVLKRFLDFDADLYGVVFCRTKRDTQNLAESLVESGYPAEPLHGDLSQSQRDAVMKRFRAGTLRVLVATDVAARGIDVDNLTHVVHFALPDDPEYYTHRSGRTARAGKKGISLSLITKGDKRKISMLENKLKIDFTKAHIPNMSEISSNRISRWAKTLAEFDFKKEIPEQALSQAYAHLSEFTMEELIEKLVGKELNEIKDEPDNIVNQEFDSYDSGRGRDRGDRGRGRRDRGDRGDRGRDRRSRDEDANKQRYFIGLGEMDDFNKGKLLRYICDNSGVTSKDIGRITVQRMHSYFDIESDSTSKLDGLKNLEYGGRAVRVNRDSDGGGRDKRKGKRDGGRDKRGGGKPRFKR